MRILTFDLKKEISTKDYDGFCKIIKEYSYTKLSKCSYALDTTDEPLTIFNKLKPYIDNNDSLLILTLNKPYYGQASEEVINLLGNRM